MSTARQKKRARYREAFLPDKIKERVKRDATARRAYAWERQRLAGELAPPPLPPGFEELEADEFGAGEAAAVVEEEKKPPRRRKRNRVEEAREAKVEAVAEGVRERKAKEQRAKARKVKKHRALMRDKQGHVLTKNVIGDLLHKIQSGTQ